MNKIKQILKGKPARNNLTIYDDDIFLVSYPRSGNTWIRFLLGTLISGEKIDWHNMESGIPDIYRNTNKELLKVNRPRFLKSHHPYEKKYNKVVYLVRDVRDVILSYYNFHLKFKQEIDPIKSMDQFIEKFIMGDLDDFGTWKGNVDSWISNNYQIKNGFLLVKYEELKDDTFKCVKDILSFINVNRKDEEINNAIEWCSFNNMKKMEKRQQDVKLFSNSDNKKDFMRSGKSGDWKEIFNETQIEKINIKYSRTLIELGYKV